MARRNLLILLLAFVTSYVCYARTGPSPYARYVADGLAAMHRGTLEPVPDRELFQGAMEGMVGVLNRYGDQHSEFLAEEEADPLRTEIRQQFGGIGVRIGMAGEPPLPTIVGPPEPGGPAARAHLLAGDTILSIDAQSTDGMKLSDVLRLMRGRAGTRLRLTVRHAHQPAPRTVEVVREVIHIESILGDRRGEEGGWRFLLDDDPRIAHIRIVSFGDRTAGELDRILDDAKAGGAEAVALDLRDNAGGALEAAVAICRLLLPAGKTIVETRGRNQRLRQRYETIDDGKYRQLPLAVLINQESASAAEIVAACLQDHGRAVVVGQRSYGKGTVQQLVQLESGRSLLKLTWASFWRPTGAKIHREVGVSEEETWGVVPDVGYESVLAPEDYAALQKYRYARDAVPVAAGKAPAEAAATEKVAAEVAPATVDKQLQLAIGHLQTRLGE